MNLLHITQASHFARPERSAFYSAASLNAPKFKRMQTESWPNSAGPNCLVLSMVYPLQQVPVTEEDLSTRAEAGETALG